MDYFLSKPQLLSLLSDSKVTRLDKVLLLLFWDEESSKTISAIKKLGSENGLRESLRWNIADVLGKGKGKAVSLKDGWTLTNGGRDHLILKGYISKKKTVIANDVSDLKNLASKITNAQTKSFIDEAILCLEGELLRAAVVLSWVGAVAILYDEIVANHLTDFNTEAKRRDVKWKIAKNADDLSRMKEAEFLNVLEAISFIGKNVKLELESCLKLRNGSGHPNSLKFGTRKIAAHIEILILNVFTKY